MVLAGTRTRLLGHGLVTQRMPVAFQRIHLERWTPDELACLAQDYEVMLLTILEAILARHERNPACPFIDTKLDLITGRDFAADPAPPPYRDPAILFGWIQGRGLEALVGHAEWLPRCRVLGAREAAAFGARVRRMIERVFAALEAIRIRNHGRMFFTMAQDGTPFVLEPDGSHRAVSLDEAPYNYSDLFYVKGMRVAAQYLGQTGATAEAERYFAAILQAIETDAFRSDQVSFDPKNAVQSPSSVRQQGPRMIALGGIALFARDGADARWLEIGLAYIQHILTHHTCRSATDRLELYDFWECCGPDGQPWIQDGRLFSDPGHALEFVGLAAKVILVGQASGAGGRLQANLEALVPDLRGVFFSSFAHGFDPAAQGICKSYDLLARAPVNTDMPWWSLPETLRAAAEMMRLDQDSERPRYQAVFRQCSNAFLSAYVNPHAHLMAYQTRGADGKPRAVIPATPDADPGYHTGLSVIDCLDALEGLGIASSVET